jgi:hypothetical protein
VSSAAIVVAVIQFQLQKRVWKSQHDRARREKAIEIIANFNNAMTAQWSSTYKLVERLSISQLKELDHGRPFSASESEANDLKAALVGSELSTATGPITLTSEQSYRLRFQALEVLNAVEIVCQAWDRDIADRTILEDEIQFLYDPQAPEPTTLMSRFRNIGFRQRNYPALHKFTAHLDYKRHATPPGPEPLNPPASDRSR